MSALSVKVVQARAAGVLHLGTREPAWILARSKWSKWSKHFQDSVIGKFEHSTMWIRRAFNLRCRTGAKPWTTWTTWTKPYFMRVPAVQGRSKHLPCLDHLEGKR